MRYYNIQRDPQPFTGGMPGGIFGPTFGQPAGSFGSGGPPSGSPGGPPFGIPGGPPFGQPPGGATTGTGPPTGAPPAFVPSPAAAQQTAGVLAVNPGAIRPCTFRFLYLWLNNGQQFWAWIVFVGSRSVAGWRWFGFRWVYFGVDLNTIDSFVCF